MLLNVVMSLLCHYVVVVLWYCCIVVLLYCCVVAVDDVVVFVSLTMVNAYLLFQKDLLML